MYVLGVSRTIFPANVRFHPARSGTLNEASRKYVLLLIFLARVRTSLGLSGTHSRAEASAGLSLACIWTSLELLGTRSQESLSSGLSPVRVWTSLELSGTQSRAET